MKKNQIFKRAILLLMVLAGAYCYTLFPDQVPTHRGFDGTPNQRSNKLVAVALFPLLVLAFIL
ncbi:MAG: DUF1648 domain-containing protein [Candidatus Peribacteria bacterium]|nr:DUF1648 domain-containing protein [Candidatus Peribacteria bacterium]